MNDTKLTKEQIRNMGIGKFSQFVVKYLYSTDWTLTADVCGVSEILKEKHKRLQIAQQYRFNDYTSAVNKFILDTIYCDENLGLFVVEQIIQQKKMDSSEIKELNQILAFLGMEYTNAELLISKLKTISDDKFIKVNSIPDDFYKKLLTEMNLLSEYQLPMSLSILIRKLFENLIIDIFRRKYGETDLSLYYDTSRRRFHGFNTLLKNLDNKKTDFHSISPNLDKSFIKSINKYRETGNSAAHSIDVNLSIESFSQNKDEINHIVHFLLRILKNI